ncbi:hypothetical protein FSARC_4461 [Fusarium sarcochroum]|uniref:Uncharacterized protein n=1 Tax=Fusarium sarcochroum TaxID=1208366 RepID=A0A8H4U1H2_9HYPO|nr:hypothetical protein FSARC_4461 [Fusarium sarcochroum]
MGFKYGTNIDTPATTEPSGTSRLAATESDTHVDVPNTETGNTSQPQETDQSQDSTHSESETGVTEGPQSTQESLVSSHVSKDTSAHGTDVTGSYSATMTTVPDGWSPTCVSGHTEWTANTWITTTSEGSSSETVVPVLVDTDECDGDDSSLILFGFPLIAGTLFKFPGAPKFSLPCIPPGCSDPPMSEPSGGEDGDDDNEDDESSKSKESSGTCTDTSTASDCLVKCTTSTGPADASITAQCTTTCSETATGCSVTGITSTTEVDACSATGDDWGTEACGVCSDDKDSEVDVENQEPESSALRRRWAEGADNNEKKVVGQCYNLPTTFSFPWYPHGNDVYLIERQLAPAKVNSPFKDISRWYQKQYRGCKVELAGPLAWPNTGTVEASPSMDHVFEKSFLRDYWREITSSNPSFKDIHGTTPPQVRNKISCDDLLFYGSTGQSDMSLIKDVYKVYPGALKFTIHQPIQPISPHDLGDFIGMDEWTNDEKGATTSPHDLENRIREVLSDPVDSNSRINQILTKIEKKIELIDRVIIGAKLASLDIAQEIMIRQNSRIYKALQNIDKNAKQCKNDPAVKSGKWSFADRYKSFMLQRFDGTHAQSINPAIANAFQTLWPSIENDVHVGSLVGPKTKFTSEGAQTQVRTRFVRLRNIWGQLKQDFGDTNPTAPSIPVPAWEWNVVTKRDDDNEGSCDIQTTTQEATTLSTVVSKSEMEQDGTTDPSSTSTSKAGLCSSDHDCESMSCEDDETPICGTGGFTLPGILKICNCAGKTATTTEEATSSSEETEPTVTDIGISTCSSAEDCEDFECDEGESPMCGIGSDVMPGIIKLCRCVKDGEDDEPAPTTTEAPKETDEPDPNADVPEIECEVHSDCDDWEGTWGHVSKWNEFLAALRQIRQQKEFINEFPDSSYLTIYTDQSDALALLKKWGNQEGWASLGRSISDGVETPYFTLE